MKKLLRLLGLQLKLQFGIAQLRNLFRSGTKGFLQGLGISAAIVVGIGSVLSTYVYLLNLIFNAYPVTLVFDAVITLVMLVAMLVVFVFGIAYGIGLYYAKDTEFLATMPISRHMAFLGKFIPALIGELGTFALLTLPAIILYGIHVSASIGFYAIAVAVIIFGPMLPFALANLVAALLMGISAIARHRDKIITFGGLFLTLGFLVVNQYISMTMMHVSPDQLLALLTGGLVEFVSSYLLPVRWAALALTGYGGEAWLNLLLFVAISLAAFALVYTVAGRIYQRSALNQEESAKRKRKVDLTRTQKGHSRVMAVFFKEWKICLRSPVYALNSLIMILMAPMFVFLMTIMPQAMSAGEMDIFAMLFSNNANPLMIACIVGVYSFFFAAMNTAGFTVYSREGSCNWLVLTLPVSARYILNGKLLFSFSISLLVCLSTAMAVIVILGFPLLSTLMGLLIAMFAVAPILLASTVIDIIYPRLHWDSETKSIKTNINALISTFLVFGFMFLAGFSAYFLIDKLNMGFESTLGIILGVCAIISVGLYMLLFRNAEKWQSQMGRK